VGIQAGFVWAAAHKEGVGTVSCCLHRCVGGGGGVLLQHTTASARRLSHQHMCSLEKSPAKHFKAAKRIQ
jgi:hypothetical protein